MGCIESSTILKIFMNQVADSAPRYQYQNLYIWKSPIRSYAPIFFYDLGGKYLSRMRVQLQKS